LKRVIPQYIQEKQIRGCQYFAMRLRFNMVDIYW